MGVSHFFKRLTLFLLFLVLAYWLMMSVFTFPVFKNKIPNLLDMGESDEITKFHNLHEAKNTDILFVGSSHAEFEPEVFKPEGFNIVNLTISSLRPLITYNLLRNELNKTSAKVVVLESYFDLFNQEYLITEAATYIISNEDMSPELAEMALSTKDFRVINSAVGLWLKHLYHPLSNPSYYADSVILSKADVVENGKPIVHKKSKPRFNKELAGVRLYKAPVSSIAFVYFQKCIELIKSYNKIPVLMMAPVPPKWKDSCTNYNAICKSIDSIAKKDNITYINYNDSVQFANIGLVIDEDFYDSNHLSTTGRLKFSKAVLEDIKRLNLIVR